QGKVCSPWEIATVTSSIAGCETNCLIWSLPYFQSSPSLHRRRAVLQPQPVTPQCARLSATRSGGYTGPATPHNRPESNLMSGMDSGFFCTICNYMQIEFCGQSSQSNPTVIGSSIRLVPC